jgi:F-type H+-transporting ATPase subunit b
MTKTGAALALLMLSAQQVVASSEAGGGEAEVSLFAGDFGNAIWTLVIFIAVLIVLGKLAWKPVLKALQKREEFIRDSLLGAQQRNEEAKKLLTQYQHQLEKARQEATAIVDESRRDADEVRKRIVAEAKAESDAVAKRAKKDIEMARDDAVRQLQDQAVYLATTVAAKIVKKDLTPGDHRRLVDEALSEMGKLN